MYRRFSVHSVDCRRYRRRLCLIHNERGMKNPWMAQKHIANLKALIKQTRMSFEHDHFDRVNWTSVAIFSKSSSTLEICSLFANLLDFFCERHDTTPNKVQLNNHRKYKQNKNCLKFIQINENAFAKYVFFFDFRFVRVPVFDFNWGQLINGIFSYFPQSYYHLKLHQFRSFLIFDQF